jgi:glycerol-1-phosphate dehydrogenase [NAD(P)+]
MAGQARILSEAVRAAAVTRQVVVDRSALTALPSLLQDFRSSPFVIVADINTMEVAGRQVVSILQGTGFLADEPIVLEEAPRVKPHAKTARGIAEALAARGAIPIAVGSGVLNDLTKYAAEVAGLPYICVATAASMDGYAASGAALLDDGFKRTLSCRPPVAVIADLDILARAPQRMGTWGYGDLAGKIVAGADWKLADALEEEAVNPGPFALVQDNIWEWLSQPGRIFKADPAALGNLMNGLLVSGFAMQAHGNSRPASGAEHLISHLWEMERLTVDGEPAAHGACVGIGTVAILALYEWLLAQNLSADVIRRASAVEPSPDAVEAEIAAGFADEHLAASARAEMAAKMRKASRRNERLAILAAKWPALREELRSICITPDDMEARLRVAGAAAHPGSLGVPYAKMATDYRKARLIRRRYTVLDLLEDLGWLDKAIAALFAETGFWGRRPALVGTPPRQRTDC